MITARPPTSTEVRALHARVVTHGIKGTALALGLAGFAWLSGQPGNAHAAEPTYAEHIAPILNNNCVVCHRPGGAGPFSLLGYDNARQRAALIAAVTSVRYMPPWLPTPGRGQFLGERRLEQAQIDLLGAWARAGAPAGDLALSPAPPVFEDDWHLGPPDLEISLPEPYQLQREGTDVYRTFVVELPTSRARWVRAIEFRPRNPQVVHHAIMQIDRSLASLRRDEADPGPGYEGMETFPAENPDGQILGWTPGKVPREDQGMAWRLEPGTSMVVQLHMQPTGKVEPVQPRIALYFTDQPPTRKPFSLLLRNDRIDIPADANDHIVQDELVLPVAVSLLGIYPHAHYLAREMEIFATKPGGEIEWLLHIKDWDFNWQDDYRYRGSVELPAGAKVTMRYHFDNSADNPRNPHDPPQRVRYGLRSADEMANVALQVLPARESDVAVLREALMRHRLELGYDSWYTWNGLGAAVQAQGKTKQAVEFYTGAIARQPAHPTPRYNLANALLDLGDPHAAIAEYQRVIEIEPNHAVAYNNLSIALQTLGETEPALRALRQQIELRPSDALVHHNLATLLLASGDFEQANQSASRAVQLAPEFATVQAGMGDVLRGQGDNDAANARYQQAAQLDAEHAPAHFGLGLLAIEAQQWQPAIAALKRAIEIDAAYAYEVNSAAWSLATARSTAPGAADAAFGLAMLATAGPRSQDSALLDTLAAAYAATGRFDDASATIERAIEFAVSSGYGDYVGEFESRLKLYRNRQRYFAE